MKWFKYSLILIGIGILVYFFFQFKSVSENIDKPNWLGDGIKTIFIGAIGIVLITLGFLIGKKKR